MDENQIGPNMNTTPVQTYVRDGPYPSGKAVPCNWKVPGSNPSGVNLQVYRQDQGHHGNFFFCFFCFDFVLFVGDPRKCRISALLWASQKARFRHPILILSPLSLGIPENAGVM